MNCIFILAVAFLAVFLESTVSIFPRLLGAQIDLLPALIVYASLTSGVMTLAVVSICAGIWFDCLSANPLGVSILPLFAIGFVIWQCRELLLRGNTFAQLMLGLGASALVPLLTLFLLFNLGCSPAVGLKWVWQWLVMTAGGGLATPLFFRLFDKIHGTFSYQPWKQTSFRPDREIKRGRF